MPVDKKDTDLENRVRKLLEKEKPIENTSEQDLIQRFNHVFSTQPVVAQSKPNYAIPDNAYSDEIDKQIEAMLNESDDDDIYDMLDSKQDRQLYCSLNDNIDHLQETFLGKETYNTDESHELIQRVQQEAALDHRYDQFTQQRDKALEQRYLDLKKNAPNVSTTSNSTKPKGIIPKPLGKDDLHDEMNDWCCICNDDATIECLGCEDDNTYCKPCFVYTHLSEAADYEATKHKSRPYIISQVLRQSLYNGIKAALIMTTEGSLISFAADNDKNATIYSAISANIWNTYKKKNSEVYTNLQFQILDCQEGVVFITSLGGMILCLVGEADVDLGMLRAKAQVLKGHLEGPFQQLALHTDY